MAERHAHRASQMIVPSDQPLIGIINQENGFNVVHYFTKEEEADAASSQKAVQRALDLAGAWSDLNWEEMETALDRIRHESQPTPPIHL